jgi:hypothetical protein
LLFSHRGSPGQRCSVLTERQGGITDDKDVAMLWDRQIRSDLDAARAIRLGPEPVARRRRYDARRPDSGASDPLRLTRRCSGNRSPARRSAPLPSCSSERRAASDSEESNAGSSREPASTKKMRAHRGSMDRESRALCELGDRVGHLDARWTAADHDEIEETTELARVRLDFGALERQQDPPMQIGGVVSSGPAQNAPTLGGRNSRAERRSPR